MRRAIMPLCLGLALATAAGGIFWRALSIDDGSPDLPRHLRTLSTLIARRGEAVLSLRFGLSWSYDSLVEIETSIAQEIAAIDASGLESDAELQERWQELRQGLLAEQEQIERFKSQNSILRNSLRFLPTSAAEAEADLRRSNQPALAEGVQERLRSALVQIVDPGALHADPQADPVAEAAAAHRPGERSPAEVFALHEQRLLEVHAQTQLLVQHILFDDAPSKLEGLHALLESRHELQAARAQGERTALYALAAALGLLVAITTIRLWARGAALRQLNETLEDRVREGTAQLAQAQKLEAIGRLAAGIAHEINTPAQFVSDNLQFLRDSAQGLVDLAQDLQTACSALLPGNGLPKEEIEKILGQADVEFLEEEIPQALSQSQEGMARVTSIVKAMKEFSHPGGQEKRAPVDLNQAIENTLVISRNEWKTVAQLRTDLDPELPSVPLLRGEFNQAILNIIVNAAQAIAEQQVGNPSSVATGCITVRTRREGDEVCIQISDTGPGMTEEVRSRAFDPFFTTKPVGQGTGQGLAIARSAIVDKHGGSISIESVLGKGTTFHIRLPLG